MSAQVNVRIGDRAAYYGCRDHVFYGTVIDIREEDGERFAYIATPGWPEMWRVRASAYQRRDPDGMWRACLHDAGTDITGRCFVCYGFPGPAPEESSHA